MASQNPKTASHTPVNRREVLRAHLHNIVQQRELKDLQKQSQAKTTHRKRVHAEKRKAGVTKVLHLDKS